MNFDILEIFYESKDLLDWVFGYGGGNIFTPIGVHLYYKIDPQDPKLKQ